jgi:hypothetical protein
MMHGAYNVKHKYLFPNINVTVVKFYLFIAL